ncbi:uncharacterized protein LOC136015957 [Lathamus discolor]|uniref:uncharacterized protein LOC136015957 n=1 Tax=Lathamus discolor TaxID=678569 RepID=UPI0032B74AE8
MLLLLFPAGGLILPQPNPRATAAAAPPLPRCRGRDGAQRRGAERTGAAVAAAESVARRSQVTRCGAAGPPGTAGQSPPPPPRLLKGTPPARSEQNTDEGLWSVRLHSLLKHICVVSSNYRTLLGRNPAYSMNQGCITGFGKQQMRGEILMVQILPEEWMQFWGDGCWGLSGAAEQRQSLGRQDIQLKSLHYGNVKNPPPPSHGPIV